jgi:TonB family protein
MSIKTGKTTRRQLWHDDQPLALGLPINWIVESVDNEVVIRQLSQPSVKSSASKQFVLSDKDIASQKEIKLPLANTSQKDASLSLSLRMVDRNIKPLAKPVKSLALPVETFKNAVGIEHQTYMRSLQGSAGSLVAILLLAVLWPKSEKPKEEIIPPQVAKIIMRKSSPPPAAASKSAQMAKAVTGQNAAAKAAKASVVQAFQSQSLKSAANKLLKGGMAKLLTQSSSIMGNAGTKMASRAIASSSNALQSGAPVVGITGQKVAVAVLGGNDVGSGDSKSVGYNSQGGKAGVSGQGQSYVKIDADNSSVDEGLSKEEVGSVIHKHMAEIRYCYEASMVRNPSVQGKLVVAFTIGAPGTVKAVELKDSSLGDPKLDDCIIRRLSSWRFPQPRGGTDVAVTYPFIFKSLGG